MSDTVESLRAELDAHDNDPDFWEYAGDLPTRMMDMIENQQAVVDTARAELEMIGMGLPHPDDGDDSDRAMYALLQRLHRILNGEVKPVCENCGDTGWQSEDPDRVPGGQSPCPLCNAYSKRLDGEVKP